MFGFFQSLTIIAANVYCNIEERSLRGRALLNHTYKSWQTENYPSCLMACIHDSQCKSLNYWWYGSECDLNNRTKYSAEAKFFRRGMLSTYMGMTRERGRWDNRLYVSLKSSRPLSNTVRLFLNFYWVLILIDTQPVVLTFDI